MQRNNEEKIRVIIAEDEPPIGRFLSKLVEQKEGFEVVEICLNGEAAIQSIREKKADLIISDIRMPGISGLELISRIKQESEGIKAIIVTGFKMFEYAKEAITLGIDAFITKPINPQEFEQALENIKVEYQQTNRKNLFMDLGAIIRHRDEASFCQIVPFQRIRCLILYYSGDSADMIKVIREVLPKALYACYKEAVLVFEDADTESVYFPIIMRRVLCLKERNKTCIAIGISKSTFDGTYLFRLQEFYRNNVRKLAVPGKSKSLWVPDLEQISLQEYKGDERLFQKIELAILAKDEKQFFKILRQVFDDWKEQKVSVYHMRRKLHITTEIMERAKFLSGDKVSINDWIDETIMHLDSYEEIKDKVEYCWKSYIYNEEECNSRDERIFRQIVEYIEKNRQQNYSLKEISNIFGASQPYIRKVFKQYTSKSYNEYVMESKIDYAIRLIEANPDIYVKEVADLLGFEQLYFGTVFKKITGISPSVYKIQAMEKKKNQQGQQEKSAENGK